MSRLLIIFLFLLISQQIIGQKNVCSQETDTSLCYIRQNYPTFKFGLEKKYESDDLIYNTYTPLLADVDGDCVPELMTPDFNDQNILFIDTKSGAVKYRISTFVLYPFSNNFCIADINGDGLPELFVIASPYSQNPLNIQGRLICYNMKGEIIWISDQRVDLNYLGDLTRVFGVPALADFNQDGIPEIYVGNKIFNAQTGVKLADGGPNGTAGEFFPYFSPLSIAAQLDEDSTDLELAAGYSVYKVLISNPNGMAGNIMIAINIKINNEYRDGATTISDINIDGRLDVVVTSSGLGNQGLVYVYTLSNGISKLIAKAYPPGGVETAIGSPFIGDIKGIGKPSILFSRVSKIYSYSYNGSGFLQQDWSQITTDTSGLIGITMFDLNNDGIQEIIYRDMNSLSILDGSSIPVIISSINCFSPTWYESAIVGDFDNSGHAKICVPCSIDIYNTNGKLTIFGSPDSLPGWAPARSIWNQYNYHVLNINDDLTVPRVQKNNATYKNGKYNNFYVQESRLEDGMYLKKAASLTGKIKCINYDPINNEYLVIFDIYNRTDASFNADSSLPVSFYNGDPTSGGILIGTYYTLKKLESGDSLLNLEFTFSASNLTDLFMVINTMRNGSGQFDPVHFSIAECDYTDNISRTLELPKVEKINAAICEGNGYQFYDTLVYDAGMYHHKINSVTGCDSIIFILEVTTTDSIHINQIVTSCDAYSWNGQTYSQSGKYLHDTTNRFGCDSITTLNLIINLSNAIVIPQTACDSFVWNGTTYDMSGTYPYQSINSVGCDSTITLELIIHTSDTIEIQHETCESYIWNGQSYIQSGTYTYDTTNRFGCDSSVSLQLTINLVINTTVMDAACNRYTWNGQTYTQSGSYQYKTINNKGCDSITTLHLTVNKSSNSSSAITACDGYTWNGVTYDQSGSYQFQTLKADGCDSIATLQLSIHKSNNSNTDLASCNSYTWNGQTYSQSGSFQYKTQNVAGCDSTATLNLTINKSDDIKIDDAACNIYVWNGSTYTQSGAYQFKTVNVHGCDSVINLNLTINKSTKAEIALSVCDSLNFLGNILKANGNYTFMIQNAVGCDSVINLNLSIRYETYNHRISNCDEYIWPVNGQKYEQSGVYLKKYTNAYGCDSIYILDLNILNSYEFSEQVEACKQYLWPVNNTLLRATGEYIHALKTSEGCDSTIKLNLIINPLYEKADTVIASRSYTWPINQQTYTISGNYEEDYTSTSGCDSIHLLYLLINKDFGIYYPNVINPNGQDRNTRFTLFDNGFTISQIESLSIYDRWGNLLWQKQHFPPNEVEQGWNAKCNEEYVIPGVYVWHAQLALSDGSMITEKGNVTVVR